jgi:DNA-binding MltR family transcriptional regulator
VEGCYLYKICVQFICRLKEGGLAEIDRTAERHRAYVEFLTGRFYEAIDRHEFELNELPALASRLRSESQTGQVLIMSSYLEERFEHLMGVHLRDVSSKKKRDEVFGSNGPLSTFGSQVTLCYQLGWLSDGAMRRLRCFKSIRNKFAHDAYKASYSDQDVKLWFEPLESELYSFYRSTSGFALAGSSLKDLDLLSNDERKICSMVLLLAYTCLDLLIYPEAVKHGLPEPAFVDGAPYPKSMISVFQNVYRCVHFLLKD